MDPECPSTSSQDNYGVATYAMSRHRKNKILVWKSRKHEGRVYEFTLATRFRMAGVFSWRCLQCSLIRDKMKRMGQLIKDKKVPLLLVDNDVIKEDPDRPNNAAHFCEGRDLVESAVLRSKLLFYEAHEKTIMEPREVVDEFLEVAANATPFQLTANQRRSVERYVSEHVTKIGMKKTLLRRRKISGERKTKKAHIVHEKYNVPALSHNSSINKSVDDSSSCKDSSDEKDEFIDVEGDHDCVIGGINRKYCRNMLNKQEEN